jgi:hypothetical protein
MLDPITRMQSALARSHSGSVAAPLPGKELRFLTEKIDLEIEVGVETEVGGKGEVKFRFLVFDATLGADAKGTITNTQTIKLSLAPVYKGQTDVMVAGTTTNKPL